MDAYRSFNETTYVGQRTEFQTFCDEVRETLINNNKQHAHVRELCSLFGSPVIHRTTYSSHVHFSPDLKYAISVPLLDKTCAMAAVVVPESYRLEDMSRVFDSNSRVRKVTFNSDSSLALVASEEKLCIIALNSRKKLVTILSKDLDSPHPAEAVVDPSFISFQSTIHLVPLLSETSLISEDIVYVNLRNGKILLVDLRGWKTAKDFKPRLLTITLEGWQTYCSTREMDHFQMLSPTCILVLLKDESAETQEAVILDINMAIDDFNTTSLNFLLPSKREQVKVLLILQKSSILKVTIPTTTNSSLKFKKKILQRSSFLYLGTKKMVFH